MKITLSQTSSTSDILCDVQMIDTLKFFRSDSKKSRIYFAVSGSSEAVGSSKNNMLGKLRKDFARLTLVICPDDSSDIGWLNNFSSLNISITFLICSLL